MSPSKPVPPYIAGVQKTSITVGWLPNDEGTGLVDEYTLEYKEMFKQHQQPQDGWKTLSIQKWAPAEQLLHIYEKLPPNASYTFRVKARNKIGWGVFSEPSEIVTTEASHPDR